MSESVARNMGEILASNFYADSHEFLSQILYEPIATVPNHELQHNGGFHSFKRG